MWRPIKTAPRDGTEFVAAVWWSDEKEWEVLAMKWHGHVGRFGRDYAPFIDGDEQPLLWQPFPDAPTDQPTR